MKKLLLLLVGVVVAFSMHATDIYLWGNNVSQGWTSNPTHYDNWKGANDPTIVSDDNNVFKFTAKGDFYLSKVKANNNDDGGWEYNKKYGLIVDNSSNNSCCWAKDGNLYKATMISRDNASWTANSQAPSAWSNTVVYYKITKSGDNYTIEAATSTNDFGGGSTSNSAPLNLIGDSYSPDNWFGAMKANYSAPDADVLNIQTMEDGSQYYIFTAQGKFALSNQTVKGWGEGDNEWKKKSLKTGTWTNNDGIYSASLSSTTSETALYPHGDQNESAKFYFRVNAAQTTIECTTDITKFGASEPEPLPEGVKYYVMGNFSLQQDTPFLMVPSGGRYTTTLFCNHPDGWLNMVFYSVAPAEDGGAPVVTYYNSNGDPLDPTKTYGLTAGTADNNRIDVSALDPTKTYTVLFNPFNEPHPTVEFSEFDPNGTKEYYLSGDINVWSDCTNRNTSTRGQDNGTDANKDHGFFSGESNDEGNFFYLQDDPDNPWVRFKSKEEMEAKWKFQFVGPGPEGTTGNNWYRLNLMARGSADLNDNVGRLGGQFKIIQKSLEKTAEGWGVNQNNNNAEYWKKLIRVGQVFQGEPGAGQNFMLYNTTIENAVIWFNPSTSQVLILGQEKDLYMYYANDAQPNYSPKVYMNVSKQVNNYPHVDPFREYSIWDDGSEHKQDAFVANGDGDYYDFSWKKVDEATYYPYGKNGVAVPMTNVWRKKIPSSIIHRTPMPYLTSVKPYAAAEGQWFPRVRIDCDDIWFIESTTPVHVFFRFADASVQNSPATKVYFNAWLDQYDAQGSLMDPLYLKNSFTEKPMVKISKNSTGEEAEYWSWIKEEDKKTIGEGDDKEDLSWFVYPDALPVNIANAGHAMFATSYGGEYPTLYNGASVGDRESVALNGHDLYYVVGGSSSRVGLLYSHLKGTFVKGDDNTIQINAEFFAKNHGVYKEGDLNTTIGSEVDYQFSILNDQNQQVLGSDAEKWYDEPCYNWDVTNCESGLYRINVRVRKLVNGKYEYYSSNDIYPIFSDRVE